MGPIFTRSREAVLTVRYLPIAREHIERCRELSRAAQALIRRRLAGARDRFTIDHLTAFDNDVVTLSLTLRAVQVSCVRAMTTLASVRAVSNYMASYIAVLSTYSAKTDAWYDLIEVGQISGAVFNQFEDFDIMVPLQQIIVLTNLISNPYHLRPFGVPLQPLAAIMQRAVQFEILESEVAGSKEQPTSFEVTAQVGGRLGDMKERLGIYNFDKMHNGAAAYTNGKYIVFYGGDKSGWQWVTGYNQWAGWGLDINEIPDAQSFITHAKFQLASDVVEFYPTFEVTAQVGGNLGDGPARIGMHKFDKMYNGAAAYTNGQYIVFYGGARDGWQWVTGFNQWAGNGPALSAIDDAQGFVTSKQFQLGTDEV